MPLAPRFDVENSSFAMFRIVGAFGRRALVSSKSSDKTKKTKKVCFLAKVRTCLAQRPVSRGSNTNLRKSSSDTSRYCNRSPTTLTNECTHARSRVSNDLWPTGSARRPHVAPPSLPHQAGTSSSSSKPASCPSTAECWLAGWAVRAWASWDEGEGADS